MACVHALLDHHEVDWPRDVHMTLPVVLSVPMPLQRKFGLSAGKMSKEREVMSSTTQPVKPP